MPSLNAEATSTAGERLPARAHVIVWGALLALIVLLVVTARVYEGRRVWERWRESGGLGRASYAERIYPDDFFRTPANTWSNLAFVTVGFYGFAFGWHDLRRRHRTDAEALEHLMANGRSTPGAKQANNTVIVAMKPNTKAAKK